MKFKVLEIHTPNPQDIFETHRKEISKAIIEAIAHGVDKKRKKVTFAKVIIGGFVCISLSVDKKEFIELIDENIKTLIEYEEYEICALGTKIKSKIQENEKVTEKNRILV
jgi:hypothetical protein